MPPLAADAACRTDGHILQSAERHPELPPSAHHEHGHAVRSGVGHQCRSVDADAARLQHAASHPRQVLYGTTCPSAQVRGIAVSGGTHRKFPIPPLSPSWRRAGRLFSPALSRHALKHKEPATVEAWWPSTASASKISFQPNSQVEAIG